MKNLTTGHWAILKADKGIIRKKDIQVINNGYTPPNSPKYTSYSIYSISQDILLKKLNNIKGKLEKSYKVLQISDHQLGQMQMHKNNYDHFEAALKVATDEQKNSIFYIK